MKAYPISVRDNLRGLSPGPAEVARLFRTPMPDGLNMSEEIYPGDRGMVIADGQLRVMTWGFPFAQTSKRTGQPLKPKPVNNARTDKLSTGFWRPASKNAAVWFR